MIDFKHADKCSDSAVTYSKTRAFLASVAALLVLFRLQRNVCTVLVGSCTGQTRCMVPFQRHCLTVATSWHFSAAKAAFNHLTSSSIQLSG